jgi:hypothetical protein
MVATSTAFGHGELDCHCCWNQQTNSLNTLQIKPGLQQVLEMLCVVVHAFLAQVYLHNEILLEKSKLETSVSCLKHLTGFEVSKF